MPAALPELLAMVPRLRNRTIPDHCSQVRSDIRGGHRADNAGTTRSNNVNFSDNIQKKDNTTLRIGFQNISGLPSKSGKLKDELLRKGISKFEFDIFGLAETNVDWIVPQEEHQLHSRTRFWWDSLSLSTAWNMTIPRSEPHQVGGTAIFSIGHAAHWVLSKGADRSVLGRWCWTRFRGKDNHYLRIISAYRLNDSKGPLTAYSQHKRFFQQKDDDRCPRKAFLEDLCSEIELYKADGDNIVLMLDGNDDMRRGDLYNAFSACHLRECIPEKHGNKAVNMYRRNTRNIPIDGIWLSPSLEIKIGGYFKFDAVFPGTDHCTIWIDISYSMAFGHNMAPITKPQARRLHCRDPRLVDNFTQSYEAFIKQHKLLDRAVSFSLSLGSKPVWGKTGVGKFYLLIISKDNFLVTVTVYLSSRVRRVLIYNCVLLLDENWKL
jgi:hypothetical protein